MATQNERSEFRLTVLNPSGRDPEQYFPDGAGESAQPHPPINFHAYAACTHGVFHRETRRALAEKTPVLLLLRGDFAVSERALTALQKEECNVAVSLKETGLHQIADQLRDPSKLSRFIRILNRANCCLAATPEAADIYRSVRGASDRIAFIPTPYPIDDRRWDFSRPNNQRAGIFVGTREWNVPSRNHLAALLLARQLIEQTKEKVTVFNLNRRKGARLLASVGLAGDKVRILDQRLSYPNYLREVARHKVVLQLDTSFVPGQVAGDAMLCRVPCVGGNGAIDRIAFPKTCGLDRSIEEIGKVALRLLTDNAYYEDMVSHIESAGLAKLGFRAVAKQLKEFFAESYLPIASK